MYYLSIIILYVASVPGCTATSVSSSDATSRIEYSDIPRGEYEIISIKDISYAIVRRYVARVRVGYDNSPADVESILKDVALDIQRDQRAQAVSVFAIGPDESEDFAYSAGKLDYAPGGDWGSAHQRLPMAYDVTLGEEFFGELSRQRSHASGTTHILRSHDGSPIELYDNSDLMDNIVGRVNHGTEITIADEVKYPLAGDYLIRYRIKATTKDGQFIVGWVGSHSLDSE